MSSPIKIGLLGLGRAGNGMHRSELKSRPDYFSIYAVCDEIYERCEKFEQECGSKPYKKYKDMLRDPEIELIDIATRSCDHYKHAKMALEAGKSVLLEKPFCTSVKEAKKLIELASKENGPRLYIRHNRRFETAFQKVNEIIASGKLGDVYEIRLARNGYQRRKDWQTIKRYGGGQLLNWGPHIVDHSLRFCGGAYKKLFSTIRQVAAAGDCEDHIKIVMEGVNGRIVDMEISGGVALRIPEYTVYGSKGTLIADRGVFTLRYLDPSVTLPPVVADPSTPTGGSFGNNEQLTFIDESFELEDKDGTHRIWDALYQSIRHGLAYPIPNEEALAVVEVIERVKKDSDFK